MKYLNENMSRKPYKYTDFLKSKKKVIIDGEKGGSLDTLEGFAEIHPRVEYLELSNVNIESVAELNKLENLNELVISDCHLLRNLDGLKGLELENLKLYNLESFERLGDCDIFVRKLNVNNCEQFNVNNDLKGIKAINHLVLDNVNCIKDLSFLKVRKIPRIALYNLEMETLFGIQFFQSNVTYNRVTGCKGSDLEYHLLFYERHKNKGIKDYWKEIVEHWLDEAADEENFGFDVLYDSGELKELIFDGIKLPIEEVDRLFTPDQARVLRSLHTVKKYNL